MARGRLIFASFVLLLMVTSNASAAVARVFLAGTGNDANDCTVQSTPCQSLQGAVNVCPVNGEIIILDNGGYGAATINKSLTVNASAGVVAFIGRTITVNIGASDKVVLRGVSMDGVAFGDPIGINYTGGGTLVVENSIIAGFSLEGILQSAAGSDLLVNNCDFRNTGYGIWNNTGSNTNSNTVIENSRFQYNLRGVRSWGAATITIRNSVVTNNGSGINAESVITQSQTSLIIVDTCTIANNTTYGLEAVGQNGGVATIAVTNSTIFNNATAIYYTGGATLVRTFGNNRVYANAAGTIFGGGTLPLQ